MDRRTILAVVLCVVVYYVWMIWVQATTPPVEEVAVEVEEPVIPEAPVEAVPVPLPTSDLPVRTGEFAACGTLGEWTTDGGALRGVTLRDYQAPYHVTPLWQYAVDLVTGSAGSDGWKPYGDPPGPVTMLTPKAEAVVAGTGPVGTRPPRVEVVEESAGRLVTRGVTAEGVEVTRTLQERRDGDACVVDVTVAFANRGGAYEGDLWVGVFDELPEAYDRYHAPNRPTGSVGGSIETWADTHAAGCTPGSYALEAPYTYEGQVDFFGLTTPYFSTVLLPEAEAPGSLVQLPYTLADGTTGYGSAMVAAGGLAAGEAKSWSYRLYVGPNEVDLLKAVDERLTGLVDFGVLSLFAWPLHWLLTTFHDWIGNWGPAIMVLTLLVKAVFFPLTQMAFKSGQRMQALQPEMTRLREELKDNQEELQRRTMALFREHGVNPFGGCLPMIVQMPIWIALYQVLLYSVELYQAEFLIWRDLSSMDPYCILPTIAVVLMVIQQQLTPMANMDPAQARMMKLMPLIFGLFFFTFPAGLVLYIFVNMVLTILQQWLIKRQFGTPAPAAVAKA